MKHVAYLVLVVAGVLCGGCAKPQGAVIARVGDAVLTLEEASLAVDSSRGSYDQQVRAYAASWVINELLHQEAEREGVDKTEQFERQAKDAVRQLAVQAYLEKHVYADTIAVNDSSARSFFSAHTDEFMVREDIRKMNIAVLAKREHAVAFVTLLSQGIPWNKALERISSGSSSPILLSESEQYYTKRTITPPELWKVASTLSENEPSFPVKTSSGYVVMQLLQAIKEGATADFDAVRDEVRQRVLMEQRRKQYDDLLVSLRNKYSVQLFFPLTDTTHAQPGE